MANQQLTERITIQLIGYDFASIKDLEQAVRVEPGVDNVERVLRFQDGLVEHRDLHQTAMQIKLVIDYVAGTAVGTAIGRTAVDIFKSRVTEWLKKRGEGNAEVDLLYGPDGKPVVKVKKRDLNR